MRAPGKNKQNKCPISSPQPIYDLIDFPEAFVVVLLIAVNLGQWYLV